MLKLFFITTSFFLGNTIYVESIYTLSVTTIEGVNKPLSVYTGKKMLIVTLPTQQNSSNDSLLYSLDSLSNVYAGTLVIIATPSYEDGYTPARKNELKQWYKSKLGQRIIITEGMRTRKTSGAQQHPLFKWLTDKNRNGHFDADVTGPRYKFIVWMDGELTAVLGALTKIGGSTMNSLLQGQ